MNYDKFVMGLVSPESMATEKDQRLTAALGLVGEAIEFDFSIDEAGDNLWYLTFALNVFGSSLAEESRKGRIFTKIDPVVALRNYLIDVGKFSEYIKKTTYHGKELEPDLALRKLEAAHHSFLFLLHCLKIRLTDVMIFNIKKLEHRYPEGFKAND